MGRPWLRLDAHYRDDRKVRRSSWWGRVCWPAVLCELKNNDGVLASLDADEFEDLYRGPSIEQWQDALDGFVRMGLLVEDGREVKVGRAKPRHVAGWIVPRWEEYQPDSRPRSNRRTEGPRDVRFVPGANGSSPGQTVRPSSSPGDGTGRDVDGTGRDETESNSNAASAAGDADAGQSSDGGTNRTASADSGVEGDADATDSPAHPRAGQEAFALTDEAAKFDAVQAVQDEYREHMAGARKKPTPGQRKIIRCAIKACDGADPREGWEVVRDIVRWVFTSPHERAQFLRDRSHTSILSILRPSNLDERRMFCLPSKDKSDGVEKVYRDGEIDWMATENLHDRKQEAIGDARRAAERLANSQVVAS